MQAPTTTKEFQTSLGKECGAGAADTVPFRILERLIAEDRPVAVADLRGEFTRDDASLHATLTRLTKAGYVESGSEENVEYFRSTDRVAKVLRALHRFDSLGASADGPEL